jgi:hypothetical protein
MQFSGCYKKSRFHTRLDNNKTQTMISYLDKYYESLRTVIIQLNKFKYHNWTFFFFFQSTAQPYSADWPTEAGFHNLCLSKGRNKQGINAFMKALDRYRRYILLASYYS